MKKLALILVMMIGSFAFALEPQTATTIPHIPQQTFAINPLFLPFGTATAEYEHVLLSDKTSLGVSGWYEYDNVKARWAYLKLCIIQAEMLCKGLASD